MGYAHLLAVVRSNAPTMGAPEPLRGPVFSTRTFCASGSPTFTFLEGPRAVLLSHTPSQLTRALVSPQLGQHPRFAPPRWVADIPMDAQCARYPPRLPPGLCSEEVPSGRPTAGAASAHCRAQTLEPTGWQARVCAVRHWGASPLTGASPSAFGMLHAAIPKVPSWKTLSSFFHLPRHAESLFVLFQKHSRF